jgi:hypothetical protein
MLRTRPTVDAGQHHSCGYVVFRLAQSASLAPLEENILPGAVAALETLAAWWAMGHERDALMPLVGDALVSDDVACIELLLDLVLGLPDFYRRPIHATGTGRGCCAGYIAFRHPRSVGADDKPPGSTGQRF